MALEYAIIRVIARLDKNLHCSFAINVSNAPQDQSPRFVRLRVNHVLKSQLLN